MGANRAVSADTVIGSWCQQLSRFVQRVELDPSQLLGHVPVELFGETVFPKITESPYFLNLGPHTFYWFRLEQRPHRSSVAQEREDAAAAQEGASLEQAVEAEPGVEQAAA